MADTIITLTAAVLAPGAVALLLVLAEKKSPFQKLPNIWRQLVIGLIFGATAIITTRHGVELNGATTYVRNAAPITAALLFGAPAGIISGLVGAVGCWQLMLQSAGLLTALADSLSVLLAGALAGCLRVYMFDDKKPTWFYGFAFALVMEDVHMLLLFLIDIGDIHSALELAERAFLPTVLLNAFAVALALAAVSAVFKKKDRVESGRVNITQNFQRWLLVCVAAAFLATLAFTSIVQTKLADKEVYDRLYGNIQNVGKEIDRVSDNNILRLAHTVAERIDADGRADDEFLETLTEEYNVSEISVIDRHGVIIAATYPDFVGYDMASGEQSAEFLTLLSGTEEYVADFKPISYDESISRKYAGVTLRDGGFVQVGYDAERAHQEVDTFIQDLTIYRRLSEEGFIVIFNGHGEIVSNKEGYSGGSLEEIGFTRDLDALETNKVFSAEVYGVNSLCMYDEFEGYTVLAVQPEEEALFSRNVAMYIMGLMEIIVFFIVFVMVYFLIKKIVVDNIHRINGTLAKIVSGDLNVTVDVHSNEEFSSLSDDINSTVQTLKRYIAEAEARIDAELEFARVIQLAALPSVFPPYPNRDEFEIFASMDAAKEVGGDFYDFFFANNETLVFLVADVSGKGIPAAMFMMTAKALIKGSAEAGMPADAVFNYANAKLCEGNEAKMFVTAWMGMINLRTGLVRFVNAGHNPPLVRRRDGGFEYLTDRSGIMLAMRRKSVYAGKEIQLEPGDELFLYTDGVTEATNGEDRLYGDDRLKTLLNGCPAGTGSKELCGAVRQDIDLFVGDAPQFDDITMLSLRYITRMGEEKFESSSNFI